MMDISSNSTVVAETETPTRVQPAPPPPPPSFTNGVLKRHAAPPPYLHHHHPVVVTYKECLKNHAAALGGHAVDGCGEFMPSPATNPADPTSLKCAACGCHRNFHRRESDGADPPNAAIEYRPHHRHHPPPPPPQRGSSPDNSSSPPPISSSYYPASAPHMLLALSHGLAGEVGPGPGPVIHGGVSASPLLNISSNSRKRYRTRFTQDQKDKMLEFADKVGWRMLKKDEDLIGEFCSEIGVDKGVFKVWMHNNKNTFGKKDSNQIHQPHLANVSSTGPILNPPPASVNGGGISYAAAEGQYRHHHQEEEDRKEDVQLHDDDRSPHIHGSSSSS